MQAEKPLINRVAQSGLVVLDLENFFPKGEIASFDVAAHLHMGLILREKEFRAALHEHDWALYSGQPLAIYCSADAIVPMWAYMLVAALAAGHASDIFFGSPEAYADYALREAITRLDGAAFAGKKIVVKGCSDRQVPASAYVEITKKLSPHVQSLMFGEPCSTVPILKRAKTAAD
jgi:hypothetical protein